MSKDLLLKKDDVSIVVCGEAGQGMDTSSSILTRLFKLNSFNVFSVKEFMSRVRGGSNSTELRISCCKNNAYLERIDILIPLSKKAIHHLHKRISKDTLIIGEKDFLDQEFADKCRLIEVNYTNIAKEVGNKLFSNTVSAGVIVGLFKIDFESMAQFVRNTFSDKGEDIVEKNIQAARKGYEIGLSILEKENLRIEVKQDPSVKDDILITGTAAVALGCIAGGCNFISSYPMSPATGVLTYLAEQQKNCTIVAEQAEDEIAAINMVLGAWYAGARAIASTSGGGFALMTEGVSLAGMIESPIVLHIAQRPGPATGLPTRTEQGDLELALYAGHGDFCRIILTPGNIHDCFYLSQKAFNLADKYQIPVIILTDQYLVDTSYNTPVFDLSQLKNEIQFVETKENYQRYELTDSGITPRGIPGYGKGFVCVDSDEHDETGHITESMDVRNQMVEKRFYKRMELIKKDIITPELIGNKDYKTLIIGWGSTYNSITEALKVINRDDVAYLYYKQVYPLHPDTANYINKAENVIIIEQNVSGQFAKLIKLSTGIEIKNKILKYDGIIFSVEEIVNSLKEML